MEYIWEGGRGVPNIGPMDYIWEGGEGSSQYRTNGIYLGRGGGEFPI